jgi:hypothetical protein
MGGGVTSHHRDCAVIVPSELLRHKAAETAEKRAFSTTAGTGEKDEFTHIDRETDAPKSRRYGTCVREGDIVYF